MFTIAGLYFLYDHYTSGTPNQIIVIIYHEQSHTSNQIANLLRNYSRKTIRGKVQHHQ